MAGPTADDMKDIQGFVISGYAHLPCVSYLLLRVNDPVAARGWLAQVLKEVTTSEGKELISCLNVAISHHGLMRLGLDAETLDTFSRPVHFGIGVSMSQDRSASHVAINSPGQVLFASLIGTTIEFFDFYIYATAAVIVFPRLFFPATDPASATLASLATFGIAFVARPVGSALFGHFGDRIGRKTTLVAALLTMGLSTVIIGALPTYSSIGVAAPLLLALCRFGQGLGLGGEWSGAVLLAVENAPPEKRAFHPSSVSRPTVHPAARP